MSNQRTPTRGDERVQGVHGGVNVHSKLHREFRRLDTSPVRQLRCFTRTWLITQREGTRFPAPQLGHPLGPAHGLGLGLGLQLGLGLRLGLAVRPGLGRPLGLAVRLWRLLALELEQYSFVCPR